MITKQKHTRSEQKRQSILEAARDLFREHGVGGTSMDALAARANVSKRTVYNHFPSKEALVMHLLSDLQAHAQQQIRVKYDAGKALDAQLLTLIGAEIEVFCNPEYLDLVRVAIGHFFYSHETLQEETGRMTRQETSLYRWISAAAEDGSLAIDDPEFAAAQLHHLIKGACFWPQAMGTAPIPSPDEQRRIADEAVMMFLSRYQPL